MNNINNLKDLIEDKDRELTEFQDYMSQSDEDADWSSLELQEYILMEELSNYEGKLYKAERRNILKEIASVLVVEDFSTNFLLEFTIIKAGIDFKIIGLHEYSPEAIETYKATIRCYEDVGCKVYFKADLEDTKTIIDIKNSWFSLFKA